MNIEIGLLYSAKKRKKTDRHVAMKNRGKSYGKTLRLPSTFDSSGTNNTSSSKSNDDGDGDDDDEQEGETHELASQILNSDMSCK